jgi:hypothetical protein
VDVKSFGSFEMINWIVSMGIMASLVLIGSTANATAYYVSDCQAGAALGCVTGNDSNNGTSADTPWRTTSKVRSSFASIAAGSQILFAKGGAWSNSNMEGLENLNSSAADPIIFDSYSPSWGGTAKPILVEARTDTDIISLTGGGTIRHDEGYIIRNLDLRGNGTGRWGIFLTNNISDVVIDNVSMDGLDIGVYCGDYQNGAGGNRITFKNSSLTNIRNFGSLWGCANGLIENNTFDNTGYKTPIYSHPLYLGTELLASNIIVRNNKFTRNSHTNGSCVSTVVVAHGVIDSLTIENNTITEAASTAGDGCWGIAMVPGYSIAESITNLVIRGNIVANVGGIAIGCSSCPGALIERNIVVQEGTNGLVGIQIPPMAPGAGDAADGNAVVRNNSIYFTQSSIYGIGISVSTSGTGYSVDSNLIYFGANSNPTHYCFETTGLTLSAFTKFDKNLCYHAGSNGYYSAVYATLANAQAAGFDANGLSIDPALADVPSAANWWSMALASNSPILNLGIGAVTTGAVVPAAPSTLVIH